MHPLRSVALVALFALISGAAVTAVAVPITFEYRGMGSGMLNEQGNMISFDGEDFIIRATGDTDDRQSIAGGFSTQHLTAEIEINGLGLLQFVTPTQTFASNATNTVRFARGAGPLFNLTAWFGEFATWEMLSSIGPVLADGPLLDWGSPAPVVTDRGVLFFERSFVEGGRFTAQVEDGEAPEPVSWTLMVVGFLSAELLRRRRRL